MGPHQESQCRIGIGKKERACTAGSPTLRTRILPLLPQEKAYLAVTFAYCTLPTHPRDRHGTRDLVIYRRDGDDFHPPFVMDVAETVDDLTETQVSSHLPIHGVTSVWV